MTFDVPKIQEPTREQDDVAEAIAGRWGRSRVERLPGAAGAVLVRGFVGDHEKEARVVGRDGREVANIYEEER